jgi:ABC-type nitrate/sulfonate/bicarbonate transport system ATPase subunit
MTRENMQIQLAEIWAKTKKTIIYVTHNVAEAVYLADKVVVMSPHPGQIREIVVNDLARPRDALSPEFVEIQRHLTSLLMASHH